MELLGSILLFIFLVSMVVIFSLHGMMGKILAKHYDAEFKRKRLELPWIFSVLYTRRCNRGSMYALMLIFNGNSFDRFFARHPKLLKSRAESQWNKINYRAIARKRDWVVAVIFWLASAVFIVSMVILCIVSGIEQHYGMLKP